MPLFNFHVTGVPIGASAMKVWASDDNGELFETSLRRVRECAGRGPEGLWATEQPVELPDGAGYYFELQPGRGSGALPHGRSFAGDPGAPVSHGRGDDAPLVDALRLIMNLPSLDSRRIVHRRYIITATWDRDDARVEPECVARLALFGLAAEAATAASLERRAQQAEERVKELEEKLAEGGGTEDKLAAGSGSTEATDDANWWQQRLAESEARADRAERALGWTLDINDITAKQPYKKYFI